MKPVDSVVSWPSPAQAWSVTQTQLAWYRDMEADRQLYQIGDRATLDRHLESWASDPDNTSIGYILSLEGADSIVSLDYLETAFAYGLRCVGPAHYGVGRYALGHDSEGPLSAAGKDLLQKMAELNMILDTTHLCDRTFFEAFDVFGGPVWASHSNCRALVDDPRQFSDEQIEQLIERGAVIGVALDAWMMAPGWIRGQTTPDDPALRLEQIVDHIDHICQLAGNARHCGIGSDLDGGFGNEQCPCDVRTIADLQSLADLLRKRGYREADVQGVMHGNFIRFLREAWA